MVTHALAARAAPSTKAHRLSLPGAIRLGNHIAVDAAEAIRQVCDRHGEVVRVRMPRHTLYLTSSDVAIQHVLKTRQANYEKATLRGAFASLFGDGLIISDGPRWLADRRLMQPFFGKTSMTKLKEDIGASIAEEVRAFGAGSVNVQAAADRASLVTFARTIFGVEIGPHVAALRRLFAAGVHAVYERDGALIDWDRWFTTKRQERFLGDRAELYAIVDALVRDHTPNGTMFDALIDAARAMPNGAQWLRDHVITMLIAGHETVAATLVWGMMLLAAAPRAQAELRLGIDHGDDSYLKQVLFETMRLYPAVWCVSGRRALEADEIAGVPIAAGEMVVPCIYAMHRNARLWSQPDAFLPERFAHAQASKRPSYLPFGAGARVCIGEHMAMIMLEAALKELIARYEIAPIDRSMLREVGHDAALTLRPKTEPFLTLTTR